MDGLMMDYQLNVPAILRRADELYGDSEIVSRLPDKSWHRYSYADFVSRTKRLIVALRKLGLEDGDRVGTFMWNHSQHLEAYIGAPAGGFVTHTLNLRLHPDDNTYIATHAGDRVLIVDKVLWPLAEQFVPRCSFEHVIATGDGPAPDGTIDYEDLLADADESEFAYRDLDERRGGGDVLHERHHRSPEGRPLFAPCDRDPRADGQRVPREQSGRRQPSGRPNVPRERLVLPVLEHDAGVKQVFPGPHLDPVTLLDGLAEQKVTITAGVPTIWMGILQALDANPGGWDLSSIRIMTVGGAAPPRAMIEAFCERHGLHIVHGWGMTEMSPVGTMSGAPGRRPASSPGGVHAPCAAGTADPVRRDPRPRGRRTRGLGRRDDGRARGARPVGRVCLLRVGRGRGPLDRGRLVQDRRRRLHPPRRRGRGAGPREGPREVGRRMDLDGRARERADGPPSVAEAAVIAVPDEKWSERPLAVVVLKEGEEPTPEELREFLAPDFAKWWLPDRFEFVDEIPKTAVGKFRKTALREQFAQQPAETALVGEFVSTEQDGPSPSSRSRTRR